MRVDRLPADTVERLRKVTPEELQRRLGVLAQWQLQDGRWVTGFFMSFANTIAGGSSEIQRNIIAERVLGLPRAR